KEGTGLIYNAKSGQRFNISYPGYPSITDQNNLIELLKGKRKLFTIFTDKQGYESYESGKLPGDIKIYQIIIGRRAYINIYKENELQRHSITWQSVAFSRSEEHTS